MGLAVIEVFKLGGEELVTFFQIVLFIDCIDVYIAKPFYLGRYEVTVEQFRRFVEETGYATDAEKGTGFQGAFGWDRDTMEFKMNDKYSWRNTGFAQADSHPVVNVSWNDAMEFCTWLGNKEGKRCRLPTEAEWEYACRAGTQTAFSFGDDAGQLGDYAWYFENSDSKARKVGQKKPNPWGLYDMHGNVAEWCNDVYAADYYARSPTRNPPGPDDGEKYVLRGGAWNSRPAGCRSATRVGENPGFQDACFARDAIGFRCVRRQD